MDVLTLDDVKESLSVTLRKEGEYLVLDLIWINDDRSDDVIDTEAISINQLLEP